MLTLFHIYDLYNSVWLFVVSFPATNKNYYWFIQAKEKTQKDTVYIFISENRNRSETEWKGSSSNPHSQFHLRRGGNFSNETGSTPNQNIQCHLCPSSVCFQDFFSLTAHIRHQHQQSMPYSCTLCGKAYSTSTGLKHHMEVHEGKTFLCPICDAKFTRKGTIKTHMKSVHKLSQCSTCGEILRIGEAYNQHVLRCGTV